jgi:hypothetical protein
MPAGRERYKLANPLGIVLPKRAKSESSVPWDPFKIARKARHGTMSAVLHLHDGFQNAGKQLAEQRPLSFGEVLQMLLPPNLASAKASTEPHAIMAKLRKIGKTSWFVFKHVLKVVKAVSAPCPQLQSALEALSTVLDQLDVSAVNPLVFRRSDGTISG